MEVIDPRPREPWQQGVFEHIDVGTNLERSIQKAEATRSNPSLIVYTDGSAMGENFGAAAVMLDNSGHTTRVSQNGVGSTRN
jgi:hypothetical protein